MIECVYPAVARNLVRGFQDLLASRGERVFSDECELEGVSAAPEWEIVLESWSRIHQLVQFRQILSLVISGKDGAQFRGGFRSIEFLKRRAKVAESVNCH